MHIAKLVYCIDISESSGTAHPGCPGQRAIKQLLLLLLGNANPVLIFQTRVYGIDRIQTQVPGFDIWWVTCQWQIEFYKQICDGQMEVWLARYLDDLRRSVPVLQKRQLEQHHMSTTSTS